MKLFKFEVVRYGKLKVKVFKHNGSKCHDLLSKNNSVIVTG